MKIKTVAAVVMSVALSSTYAASTEGVNLQNNDVDKVSYSIGADLGSNIKKQDIPINPDAMAQGIKDAISGAKLQMTEQEMKDVLTKFQKELLAKRSAEVEKKAIENKAKGEAFLTENKSKPNVVTLPSGLQYKILTEGNGPKPSKDDTVTVEYTGRLINGEVFDSTEKNGGKPAEFKLSQVIPGWTEALQLMPVGSTWELYIPSNLAYGSRNLGAAIGPNETLIFNVHLLAKK